MKLNVPFVRSLRKWKGNGWCGPLALASVLRYYGVKNSVEEIVNGAKSVKKAGTTSQGLINVCLKNRMKVIYFSENFIISEKNTKYTKEMRAKLKLAHSEKLEREFFNKNKKSKNFIFRKKKAKIKDIENFLDKNKPVIILHNVAILFNKNLLWPHYVAVVGYDKNNFYIHNVAVKNQRFQKIDKKIIKKSWNCGGIENTLIVPFLEKIK